MRRKLFYFYEKIIEKSLLLSALLAVSVIFLIVIFVFGEGLPLITKVGLSDFIFGSDWRPLEGIFGVFPMIVGTFYVVFGALLVSVPLGIMCAIFLAEVASPRIRNMLRPLVELLAGIPSVVYGFFGLILLVPLIRTHFGGPGFSILAGSIILGIMVLPILIAISEDAIRSVPVEYKEASLALGATHWQTIRRVILPTARPGILAGITLGMSRAVGETMAALMVLGNVPLIPDSILDPVRTLTANIALDMGYAAGEHRQALFASGVILFLVIMLLHLILTATQRKVRG